MAALSVISMALLGTLNRVVMSNRATALKISYRATLSSIINYTQAGIKRRWCFAPGWVADNPDLCNLAHPRSSERILMSNYQKEWIETMLKKNPSVPRGNPLHLEAFETELKLTELAGDHPIRLMLSGADFEFMRAIRIKVSRLKDDDLPLSGQEIHLRIEVEFLPKLGVTIPFSRDKIMGWAHVTVYPRELSTFALIVPNDLYLMKGAMTGPGDVHIPVEEAIGQKGLQFESPVYVNGNVHIGDIAQTTSVTFSDTVVMGAGRLVKNGKPFATATAGGPEDQFYSTLKGFGGFLRGFSIDGERDAGLDYLSGRKIGSTAADEDMKQCLQRNKLKSLISETKDSSLILKQSAYSTWKVSYDMSWTKDNFFKENAIKEAASLESGAFYQLPGSKGGDKSIMRLNIQFRDGHRATATLGFNGEVSIRPRFEAQTAAAVMKLRDAEVKDSPKWKTLNAEYSRLLAIETNPPELVIKSEPYSFGGHDQDNRVKITIEVKNEQYMMSGAEVTAEMFDMAYHGGNNNRPPGPPDERINNVMIGKFTKPPQAGPQGMISYGSDWARTDNFAAAPAPLEDWDLLERKCAPPTDPTDPYQFSFQPSSWDKNESYTEVTLLSWKYTEKDSILFDSGNSRIGGGGKVDFDTVSIGNQCVVSSTANFVAGFYVCRHLVIQARGEPLRIIGTIIANRVTIDPTALKNEIVWSNIYHPNAVHDLRRARVLLAFGDRECRIDPSNPVWHPDKMTSGVKGAGESIGEDNNTACNSISLRNKVDNFRWTTVDPDCGTRPGESVRRCKQRPMRFTIKRFDRGFTL